VVERYNSAARRETGMGNSSPPVIPFREPVVPVHPSEPLPLLPTPPIHQNGAATPTAEAEIAVGAASGQIYPPPETAAALLTKLRAPYDRYERYLKRVQKRLRHTEPAENGTADEVSEVEEVFPPECTFPTPVGTLSFPELHERTRKYAAYVLRITYQMEEQDIDDGLQAGYLRLWQRLEEQPELLADKALAWMGKGIVYSALRAIRHEWQFRQKTRADGERALEVKLPPGKSGFTAHSREARQTEIRIDLHRAIGEVAEHILSQKRGKRRDHDLWALYGLTMQQVSANELSRLFGVREQSMQAAYKRVRCRLQQALPNYTPRGDTTPYVRKGIEALPEQDMEAIKKANGNVPDTVYEAVKTYIETTNADTRKLDELALEGIRGQIPAQTQAREHGINQWTMQRAYKRVHLMIGAEHNPRVRVLRPERRKKSVFTLTPENALAVEQLALELLEQPRSYEKLVALHAHIGNLAISTTAKHFNIPTSTLRYYAQQIGRQLNTPTRPAREAD
jgi:hypothetical protein